MSRSDFEIGDRVTLVPNHRDWGELAEWITGVVTKINIETVEVHWHGENQDYHYFRESLIFVSGSLEDSFSRMEEIYLNLID